MLAELDQTQSAALSQLAAAGDAAALETWRVRWLGTHGQLKALMAGLKDVPKDQKPAAGKRLNELKSVLDSAFDQRKSELGASAEPASGIDVTEPGIELTQGCRHILSRTVDEITDVFGRMGFAVAEGPEVEDEWHNFTALNIPASHPARDALDNYYLQDCAGAPAPGKGANSYLLRTQTSTVQIRAMLAQKPPIKVVATGRVYRPDTHDATHYSMFHQIEGLYVDRGVTMSDLRTTLVQFAKAYFGAEAEVRMRPSFFPFTEPSAEVDMKMRLKGQWRWVELGGCGMVDPNVLSAVNVDPETWSGFAFGLGVERIAMRKYGVADIRWLFENDARFLRQF